MFALLRNGDSYKYVKTLTTSSPHDSDEVISSVCYSYSLRYIIL